MHGALASSSRPEQILVLGPHHSGTSIVSRAMSAFGLHLGEESALLLDESNVALPYAVWALLALTAGLATLSLPETLGKPSLESIDDLHTLLARRARE